MTASRAQTAPPVHRRDSAPPAQPCSGCAALGQRVMELEVHYMELQQELHELSEVLRTQAGQIDQLERRLELTLALAEADEEP